MILRVRAAHVVVRCFVELVSEEIWLADAILCRFEPVFDVGGHLQRWATPCGLGAEVLIAQPHAQPLTLRILHLLIKQLFL